MYIPYLGWVNDGACRAVTDRHRQTDRVAHAQKVLTPGSRKLQIHGRTHATSAHSIHTEEVQQDVILLYLVYNDYILELLTLSLNIILYNLKKRSHVWRLMA